MEASDAPADVRRRLPIVPLRGTIPLPGMPTTLAIGRPFSLPAVQAAREEEGEVLLLMQRDSNEDDPGTEGLHRVGVTGRLSQSARTAERGVILIVQALARARVLERRRADDVYDATVELIQPSVPEGNAEFSALVQNIDEPGLMADFVASQPSPLNRKGGT
ncbi:MAG: LON peptidase substrate-binding domain-containing protein [Planctomycetota bacterium]